MDAVTLSMAAVGAKRQIENLNPLNYEVFESPDAAATGVPATVGTGQALKAFGNSPAIRSDGFWVHSPASGVTVNVAAYLQVQLASAVDSMGFDVVFPANDATASADLVIPSNDWNPGGVQTLVKAGVHFVMKQANWHLGYWNGTSEDILLAGTFDTPLTAGVVHRAEVSVDRQQSTYTVTLPNGRTASCYDFRIKSALSSYAIWELYEGTVTANPVKLKAFWANGVKAAAARRSVAATIDGVARAAVPLPTAIAVPTSGTVNQAVTGSRTMLSLDGGTTPIYFDLVPPPSGKVEIEISLNLVMTATAVTVLAGLRDDNNVDKVTVELVTQQYSGRVTGKAVLTGLNPSTTGYYRYRIWVQSNPSGVATVKMSAPNGQPLIVKATPLK